MAAELTRSQSTGFLYLGSYAGQVWQALAEAKDHSRTEDRVATDLGQPVTRVHPEDSSCVQEKGAGMCQIWWWTLRTPALVALSASIKNGPFQGHQ